MKQVVITLHCDIDDSVTPLELEQFLAFKYHGHSITEDVLSKFDGEELSVDHASIEHK